MKDELLTVTEALSFTRYCKKTLYTHLSAGLVPGAQRKGKRYWLIPQSGITAWDANDSLHKSGAKARTP